MNDAVRATRARVHLARCVGLMSAVAAVGCSRSWPAMDDCRATESTRSIAVSYYDPVDVLFVIDDGPSMAQEQALLAREIPRMVEALLHGADLGASADPSKIDISPTGSLHAGVASADLGAGELENRFTGCSVLGDDGVLRRSVDCGTDGRPFVWHFGGFHDPAQALEEIACNARVGAKGCAIAQPLEASLKALLPLDVPESSPEYPGLDRVTFAGTRGHGAGDNRGFFRADWQRGRSLLLVVIITDQDDCSLAEHALDVSAPGVACAGGASLQAVERYVSAFRAIADPVEVLIFAGLPVDLEPPESDFVVRFEDEAGYYDRVLSDPRLASSERPSCESANATAHAPRRLIEFARSFGTRAHVRSICRDDFLPALSGALQDHRGGHADGACFLWDPIEDATKECRVTWELPLEADPEQPLTPTRCSDRPGVLRTPSAGFPKRSERGRVLCEVPRVDAPAADGGSEAGVNEGFFFEFSPPRCPKGRSDIAFTPGAKPPSGVTVRLTCTQSECATEP